MRGKPNPRDRELWLRVQNLRGFLAKQREFYRENKLVGGVRDRWGTWEAHLPGNRALAPGLDRVQTSTILRALYDLRECIKNLRNELRTVPEPAVRKLQLDGPKIIDRMVRRLRYRLGYVNVHYNENPDFHEVTLGKNSTRICVAPDWVFNAGRLHRLFFSKEGQEELFILRSQRMGMDARYIELHRVVVVTNPTGYKTKTVEQYLALHADSKTYAFAPKALAAIQEVERLMTDKVAAVLNEAIEHDKAIP